jgi:exodeoxyribonuclease VII small subunit
MPVKKKESAEPTFEEALKRLETIVDSLESGELPLEESLRLYEEGIALSKTCADKLNKAEVVLQRLQKDAEGRFSLTEEELE